ncbi:MAG: hypothetical protein U5K73_08480 [Halofilum sp. (in: g-proteobacteria)]|nr:hypothetical protein [Halofilum sp. (in: g-proteobacteria)]
MSASAEGWRWRQDQDALARRIREKRERERAEINRLCQPGNEAEYREAARRQSEGVVGFRWHPGLALRRRPIVTAQDIELALHRLLDRFGGPSRPLPGFEAVHRHTRDAAGSLRNWRVLRALEETDARDMRDQLELAREAAHAAVEAARAAGADTAADLAQIAADIDELYQRQTGEKSHD